MNDVLRINKLFKKLYEGSPWIDLNIQNTLMAIPSTIAFKKVLPQWNSIWEIVNHLIEWRLNVLQRLQGEIIVSPDHNYFEAIEDGSELAWKHTLRRFEESQLRWTEFLTNFKEEGFDTIYSGNGMNFYEHIHGIIQHDAYHLGQIVLLAKAR